MSSQVRQTFPCLALELPPKSWPSDPVACQPARNLLPQALSGVPAMVAGFWGVDFRGITKMHRSAAWCVLQKSHKSPHPKSAHPVEESVPKKHAKIRDKSDPPKIIHTKICTQIRTKICTQALKQYPTTQRPQGVSLEVHVAASRAGF